MRNSMKWLLPAGLVVIAVLTGIFYMKSTVTHAEAIPADSIRNQLEVMYNGKVDKLKLHDEVYEAELTRSDSVYTLKVEGDTGRVMSMDLVSASPALADKREEAGEKAEGERVEQQEAAADSRPPADAAGGGNEKEKQPAAAEPKPDTAPQRESKPKPAPVPKQKPAQQPERQPAPQQNPKPQQPAASQSQKPPVQKPAPQKTVLLTEQQAVQIALRQLNGEVDDVDFV
ncbi:hypothetical protein [Sporosarcina koreensis]|uniref:hypothetical protein n=1 Tax=Sporosarcina koreensis TaxID=334735 RepID=UPI00058B76C8|nr:hypothetical protein [Sporosarcina koreensis]